MHFKSKTIDNWAASADTAWWLRAMSFVEMLYRLSVCVYAYVYGYFCAGITR